MDFEIQTYWNVETLYMVFNAIASLMKGQEYTAMISVVLLASLTVMVFMQYVSPTMTIIMWLGQAMFLVTLLNLPVARVVLTDKSGLEPPRVVQNVPWVLASIAQLNAAIFGTLAQAYETAFNVPESLGLQRGDVGFGHRILRQVNRATIREPALRADLMQFIKECTVYDVRDGVISAQSIVSGVDTWSVIFSNTSPARFVTYDTLGPAPRTVTCNVGAGVLKQRVDASVKAAQSFYGARTFTRAQSEGIAAGLYAEVVGTSYDWILSHASNASDALKQAMFNNLWREAASELPTLLNDPTRVAEVSALAAQAHAAKQADGSNATLSLLAQETLPHIRNWIEAIIYGLFPVVILLAIATTAQGARSLILGYFMTMCWIGLWPVLFAIINHLSLMHLRSKAKGLALAQGVPFQMTDVFDATLGNEQAMIGYMVVLVPFIAAGIIKMGQGGMMQVADRLFAGQAAAGGGAGATMAAGNVNIGHSGIDAASVNSTSMYKYDSQIGLSGGGSSVQQGQGAVAMMAPGGAVAIQQLQNRMLTRMGIDTRYESSQQEEIHRGQTASTGTQMAYRESLSTGLSDSQSRDQSASRYRRSGADVNIQDSASRGTDFTTGEQLGERWSEHSRFHAQTGASDNISGNMAAGLSFGPGAGKQQPAPVGVPGTAEADARQRGRRRRQGAAAVLPVAPPVTDRPARSTGNGLTLRAGVSLDSQKNYNASHGRTRDVGTHYDSNESLQERDSIATSSSAQQHEGTGQQTNEDRRAGQSSSWSAQRDRSGTSDKGFRTDHGDSNRVSRSQSASYTVQRDLLADPAVFQAVAARNGMSAMRFANQPEHRIAEMLDTYVGERDTVQNTHRLPDADLAGGVMRKTTIPSDLRGQITPLSEAPDLLQSHRAQGERLAEGVAPVRHLSVDADSHISAAQMNVNSKTNPDYNESLRKRAGPLVENVDAWASPDKRLGEGRANPMGVVEGMEVRDGVDYLEKAWDKATGGPGTADGEALTENMKRDVAAKIEVGRGGRRRKRTGK